VRVETRRFEDEGEQIRELIPFSNFGPHIYTVRLLPNGTAKIDDVKPLKRPNGGHMSGLPTTNPATDVPYDFDLNQLPYDEDSSTPRG